MSFLPEKSVSYWATLIGFVVTIISAYIAIDGYYAKAEAVRQLEMRVDQSILADRSDKLQERIWKLQDKYPDRSKAPKEVQDLWRMLEKEMMQIDIRLNKSINGIVGR